MDRMRDEELQSLYEYSVVSTSGELIGDVRALWADAETGGLEFIGVKPGWVDGRTHLIPCQAARIEEEERRIIVPFTQERVGQAPSFPSTAPLSEEDEARIFEFYGLRRDLMRGPSSIGTREGVPSGGPMEPPRDAGAPAASRLKVYPPREPQAFRQERPMGPTAAHHPEMDAPRVQPERRSGVDDIPRV